MTSILRFAWMGADPALLPRTVPMHEHDLDLHASRCGCRPRRRPGVGSHAGRHLRLVPSGWDAQRTAIAALAQPHAQFSMTWAGAARWRSGNGVGDRVARHATCSGPYITRRVLAVAGALRWSSPCSASDPMRDGGGTVATFEQMAPEAGADLTTRTRRSTPRRTPQPSRQDAGPRYGRRREHGVHGRRRGHGVHGCSRRCRRQHEPHRQRTGGDARLPEVSPSRLARPLSPCRVGRSIAILRARRRHSRLRRPGQAGQTRVGDRFGCIANRW